MVDKMIYLMVGLLLTAITLSAINNRYDKPQEDQVKVYKFFHDVH